MRTADIVGGAAGLAIGSYALIIGAGMPEDVVMNVGPSFFPSILAAGLNLFSAILIIRAVMERKEPSDFDSFDFRRFGIWRSLIALGAALLFALLLKTVGFVPLTVLFILGLMLLLGSRRAGELLLVPPLTTLVVWLLFEKFLTISLPAGLMSLVGF